MSCLFYNRVINVLTVIGIFVVSYFAQLGGTLKNGAYSG